MESEKKILVKKAKTEGRKQGVNSAAEFLVEDEFFVQKARFLRKKALLRKKAISRSRVVSLDPYLRKLAEDKSDNAKAVVKAELTGVLSSVADVLGILGFMLMMLSDGPIIGRRRKPEVCSFRRPLYGGVCGKQLARTEFDSRRREIRLYCEEGHVTKRRLKRN